jgi:DNA-binding winged helix-turn-helix (wHTH) protein
VDVNSMKPLDNLCHPVSVIREAEELAADAFGAAHAFLMVGGTTSSVQSMVLTVCKRGDEIILPRNVHRSVLNALVLCGAVPVYVNPEVDKRLGISLGMKREQVAKAIKEHPNAVAVLVNNPTYYGICSDLRAIVKMAHDAGMLCLADEAHGTHFYFGGGSLPGGVFSAQGLTINYERRKVFVDGQEVRLTQTEYNIVAFLSEHAGRVMTYAAIVRAIWGDTDASSTKKLQVNMANIRKKLGSRPGSNTYILNELGVGYRMIEEDAKPLEPAEETK